MEEEKVRLYVGGLGSEVRAGDLQERFAPLGYVQSIALPSAKTGSGHRGFAYVDFVPASDASLRKLFSAYNGCKWRGGLLRIEKAKEHFSDRLQREWGLEAASLATDPPPDQAEVVQQSSLASAWQKQGTWDNKQDMEASGLKIFFPRLKKLKTVPLTGLGKHQRSFQRVESSPLNLLLACACEESSRSGSCNCSNINEGISSWKEDTSLKNDDIAQAIEIERKGQLELLNRLFPSDSTSMSLEIQQVVELDDSEGKRISGHEGMVCSVEKTSKQSLLPTNTSRLKEERPKHSAQRSEVDSIVSVGHSDPLGSKLDHGKREAGFDKTSTAVATERAKQLELMHRLFPADAPSAREVETVVQSDKAKKKRKLDASGSSADQVEPVMDGPRGTIIDRSVHLPDALIETNSGQRPSEHQNLVIEQGEEMKMSKSITALESDDLLEGASERILNAGDDSAPNPIAEGQERPALKSIATVTTNMLSEDDSEMVLNVGDDSLSLAIAEEQEKHELKSLSARANELLEKVSEMTRYLSDNSLSLANAEVRERQISESSQDVILEDGLEDPGMTLNLGNDSISLSKAEEQEKALVRSFSVCKHYDQTRTDGSSDSEEADDMEESGSEEQDYSDDSSDVAEADEAEDSEIEEQSSEEQGYSDDSGNAAEADETEDSEVEEHSSEDQDVSVHKKEILDLMRPIRMTNCKLAKASLERGEGEIKVGVQLDESSKWAALADLCQFRTESTMQREEIKLEGKSMLVAKSNEDKEMPSTQVPDFQVDKSKAPSQQQIDAANNRGKSHDPSSSGQKLTRAAWKSLVGETGRVVFSLRQLTGSSLPNAPPLTQETQTIEGTHSQAEPCVSSKTSNQKGAKHRLAVNTAEAKHVGIRSSTDSKINAGELTNTPVNLLVSSTDVCPFMKSENAEKEWLATKSELRSDYRAKQKHAARNVKKLWGKR